MLETVIQNQSIATMVIITTSATLGLILMGLIVQTMNYVRLHHLITQVKTTEARILTRLMMMETKQESDTFSWGIPVTLEDLLKRDLEENF